MSPIFIHKYYRKRMESRRLHIQRQVAIELRKKEQDEERRQALRNVGIPESIITNMMAPTS